MAPLSCPWPIGRPDLCWHVSAVGMLHCLPHPCCALGQEPSVVFNLGCTLTSWGIALIFQMPGGIRLIRSESLGKEPGTSISESAPSWCQYASRFENHWPPSHLLKSEKLLPKHSYLCFWAHAWKFGPVTFHLSLRLFRRSSPGSMASYLDGFPVSSSVKWG